MAVIYNRPNVNDSDVINVFGMQTKERYSPKMVEMVALALEKGGHNVRIIEGNMHVIDELQNFMPRVVRGELPGMVFNMAYGIQGQSRYTHLPSMMEMLGIPYIGSGPGGHAIALDKVMSKIVFLRHNLPTPAFWVFSNSKEDVGGIEFPVIVKPRMEAVSFGLRVVDNQQDLKNAIDVITNEFEQQTLVEQFIPGREFGVSLLGNGTTLETLPIVEIDLEGNPNAIQTVDDKMKKPRSKICPANISSQIEAELSNLAATAFNALGLLDFARVDFRMDKEGGLHILEINSMASLNLTGSFVLAAQVAGLDFTALINRMLENAAIRYFGEINLQNDLGKHLSKKRTKPLHSKIRSYIRSNLSNVIDNLEYMVSINSYVNNAEGVNMLGTWISSRFQQLGFRRQLFPQVEVGNILSFTNHHEVKNDVLILSHLDTVYDHQNYIPFNIERGRIYGSGVADSKGGVAILLAALQALHHSRVLRHLKCGILLTSDDSIGGRFSKKIVNDLAINSKYVLGTKYGNVEGGIVTTCSGVQYYHIDISNIKKDKGNLNIAEIVSKKNLAWLKLCDKKQNICVYINSVVIQTNPGRRSDRAEISLVVRFNTRTQSEELDRNIRKIASKGTDGNLLVGIKTGECRLPVPESKLNLMFFEKVEKLAKMLEVRIQPIHRDISSDICHVPENIPVLGGFGPVGGDAYSPNEFIIRDSLIDRAALMALVIYHGGKW